MNWDWDKLTEKRQRQQGQQGWNAGGRGGRDAKPDRGAERDPEQKPDPAPGRQPDGGEPERKPARHTPFGGFGGGGDGGFGGRGGGNMLAGLSGVRLPGGKWLALALLLLWAASGIYIVSPDEAGVVLRFGAYNRTTAAGPHYHLPFPIEQVEKPKVTMIRHAEVGYRPQSSGGSFQQGRDQAVDEESSMLTGDENVVHVQFNIQYNIKPDGAVDFLYNVTQPDAVVKKAAEAAMREVIGRNLLDEALTTGRGRIQNEVTDLLQSILDTYQVGVNVVAVQMQSVQPPYEVRDAFKDVASARENREQLRNEAEAYRRDILPKAQGMAAQILNEGEAYKQSRILSAQGEAQRFLSVLAEYDKAPDVTRQRMLFEAMEEILSRPGLEKLILPSDMGADVLPLLPLVPGAGGGISLNAPPPPASGQVPLSAPSVSSGLALGTASPGGDTAYMRPGSPGTASARPGARGVN